MPWFLAVGRESFRDRVGVYLQEVHQEDWLDAPTAKFWAVACGWASTGGGALRDVRA